MSVAIEMEINGLRDVEKLMKGSLPAAVKRKAVQAAMLASVKEVRNDVRSKYRALGGSGALAQSVGAWRVKKGQTKRTFASIEVGPKRSNKKAVRLLYDFYGRTVTPEAFLNGIRHGHLVEFGFEGRGGRVAGKRILTNAAKGRFGTIVRNFNHNIGKAFDKAASKHWALSGRAGRVK